MLFLLVPFVIQGCAAITTTPNNLEDLSQFSKDGPEFCPGLILWPQVPAPISCDDPACRGISWAVPPYRCRQPDGVMFRYQVFGCRCCPRLVDCDDPKCTGSASEEICRSELLDWCVCVSSKRRAPIPLAQVEDALAEIPVVGNVLADLTIRESLNNEITPSSRNCPRDPPFRCLDPQCCGSDDWKTETSSTPRCNQADGKLVIDGTETALHGCPCCPEYIACSSTDCNGGENQACTSVPLHGCFCDWPGRGPLFGSLLPMDNGQDVLFNTADAFLDDLNFEPSSEITRAFSFTASSSMFNRARPLATQVPTLPPNFTSTDLLQEALQNSSILVIKQQCRLVRKE